MDNRTIAAIATPLSPGGIGIIRISGPNALNVLKKLFVRKNKSKKEAYKSHQVYYGHIKEKESQEIIDEVLAIYMAGPHSYTKEDVVEIQSHSGFILLEKLLNAVLSCGVEIANPGEFTLNAFLNGRIDLSQAEAITDLINAPSKTAAKIASRQMSGEIYKEIKGLIKIVDQIRAVCEASIEFEESDNLDVFPIENAIKKELLPKIRVLIQAQKNKAIFIEGLSLAIVGSPNVGKSSLLNRLAEKEIAIVSEIPGTTRDVVREYMTIKGIPVMLCDTAGLHDTDDPIESIGIKKANQQIEEAELLVFVMDASRKMNEFEKEVLSNIKEKPTIVVLNKIDISDVKAKQSIKEEIVGFASIEVSAKDGTGIKDLEKLIFSKFVKGDVETANSTISPNLRQRKLLEKVQSVLLQRLDNKEQIELITEDLAVTRDLLGKIIGEEADSDLYDNIFNQFCVGK